MFVHNNNIADPISFTLSLHVNKLCETSHVINRTTDGNIPRVQGYNGTLGLGYGNDVTVKRKLSAFLIVLTWTQLMSSLAMHPMLQSFNFYLMMFRKVARRYIQILIFYAIFIISFGLGFYIMFHNDVGDSRLEVDNSSTSISFETPYSALMKALSLIHI